MDLGACAQSQARSGKFIIVSDAARYYVVIAPIEEFPYHAHILAQFCSERGVTVDFNQDRDAAEIRGDRVSIHGGGYWERSDDDKIEFFGRSQAYGRFDESLMVGLGIDCPYPWKLRE